MVGVIAVTEAVTLGDPAEAGQVAEPTTVVAEVGQAHQDEDNKILKHTTNNESRTMD